jgi:hypothetical protein
MGSTILWSNGETGEAIGSIVDGRIVGTAVFSIPSTPGDVAAKLEAGELRARREVVDDVLVLIDTTTGRAYAQAVPSTSGTDGEQTIVVIDGELSA